MLLTVRDLAAYYREYRLCDKDKSRSYKGTFVKGSNYCISCAIFLATWMPLADACDSECVTPLPSPII